MQSAVRDLPIWNISGCFVSNWITRYRNWGGGHPLHSCCCSSFFALLLPCKLNYMDFFFHHFFSLFTFLLHFAETAGVSDRSHALLSAVSQQRAGPLCAAIAINSPLQCFLSSFLCVWWWWRRWCNTVSLGFSNESNEHELLI